MGKDIYGNETDEGTVFGMGGKLINDSHPDRMKVLQQRIREQHLTLQERKLREKINTFNKRERQIKIEKLKGVAAGLGRAGAVTIKGVQKIGGKIRQKDWGAFNPFKKKSIYD